MPFVVGTVTRVTCFLPKRSTYVIVPTSGIRLILAASFPVVSVMTSLNFVIRPDVGVDTKYFSAPKASDTVKHLLPAETSLLKYSVILSPSEKNNHRHFDTPMVIIHQFCELYK